VAREITEPIENSAPLVTNPFSFARPRRSLTSCAHPAQVLGRHPKELGALAASDERLIERAGAELIGNRLRYLRARTSTCSLSNAGGGRLVSGIDMRRPPRSREAMVRRNVRQCETNREMALEDAQKRREPSEKPRC
jgi:hypothetical protein